MMYDIPFLYVTIKPLKRYSMRGIRASARIKGEYAMRLS
jgi:hypothetical protein